MLQRNKFVATLFAVAGLLFLIPTMLLVATGAPLKSALFVIGMALLVTALVFLVAGGRKTGDGSGPRID